MDFEFDKMLILPKKSYFGTKINHRKVNITVYDKYDIFQKVEEIKNFCDIEQLKEGSIVSDYTCIIEGRETIFNGIIIISTMKQIICGKEAYTIDFNSKKTIDTQMLIKHKTAEEYVRLYKRKFRLQELYDS
jgi:hypothetical protein